MKKLKLNLEDIKVDSFQVNPAIENKGTAHGNTTNTLDGPTCFEPSCQGLLCTDGATCNGTCGNTCGATCGNTCGATCGATCNTCAVTCGFTCAGCNTFECYTPGNTCDPTCQIP